MAQPTLDEVVALIRDVREDLADEPVTAESAPVADLGLDSLDLIQVARLLRKRHGVELDLEAWPWKTQPLGTVLAHLHEL